MPRSCYSYPDWLASDLLSGFTEQNPERSSVLQTVEKDALTRFQKAFEGFDYQYETSLDTDLYLGEGDEVYFDFMDRKVRWINGTAFVSPLLAVPCKNSDGSDGRDIAKKFLSLLVSEVRSPIQTVFSSMTGKSFTPTILQSRRLGGIRMGDKVLSGKKPKTFSDKKWIGLALYKEGINSNSVFYAFLSFFKVIVLGCDYSDDNAIKWINANIKKVTDRYDRAWQAEVLKPGQNAGKYLYGSGRCAIAHVKSDKGKINDPDNDNDFRRIQKDLGIMRFLADEMINEMQ
jgi:hypothetical protein